MAKHISSTNISRLVFFIGISLISAFGAYLAFTLSRESTVNQTTSHAFNPNPQIQKGSYRGGNNEARAELIKRLRERSGTWGCKQKMYFEPKNNISCNPAGYYKTDGDELGCGDLRRVNGAPVHAAGMSCEDFLKTYYPNNAKYGCYKTNSDCQKANKIGAYRQ